VSPFDVCWAQLVATWPQGTFDLVAILEPEALIVTWVGRDQLARAASTSATVRDAIARPAPGRRHHVLYGDRVLSIDESAARHVLGELVGANAPGGKA